ncbi:hypothetical protein D3C86_1649710 [compost metagenome]
MLLLYAYIKFVLRIADAELIFNVCRENIVEQAIFSIITNLYHRLVECRKAYPGLVCTGCGYRNACITVCAVLQDGKYIKFFVKRNTGIA